MVFPMNYTPGLPRGGEVPSCSNLGCRGESWGGCSVGCRGDFATWAADWKTWGICSTWGFYGGLMGSNGI